MWHVGDEPVPGYRLESFLGRGSNAEVWRASAPGGTVAAMKFIALDRKLGLKEYRGVQRVKDIRHAHLLPITACWILDENGGLLQDGAVDGTAPPAARPGQPVTATLQVERAWPKTLVVAMLLGERGLHELLHEYQQAGNEGIPVHELLAYMEDAARGLDYLNSPRHDLGGGPVAIQHCDVKPQNILLVGDSAMVCDFGLARVLGGSDVCRTITGPAGTPAYVAPECIRDATPSPTSDQYSLAITYFELRTGRLPFTGESLAEVYAAHTRGQLSLDAIPEGERRVVAKATSLAPDKRYSSSFEMVRALRHAVDEHRQCASAAEAVASAVAFKTPRPGSGTLMPPAPGAAPFVPNPTPREADGPSGPQPNDTAVPAGGTSEIDFPPIEEKPAGNSIDAAKASASPAEQTCALQFDPANAKVEIDGKRRRLDPEGRVEIPVGRRAAIAVSATAPGCKPFRERLVVAEIEWPVHKIRLRRDAKALVQRGIDHLKEGNVDAAIADFDEAIELAPDMAEAYYGRAMAHGATPEYRRDCAQAFNEQAHERFAQGDFKRAAADFTQAIDLNPALAEADRCRLLRNRALAYRRQGLFDDAIADYDRVIHCHPDFAKAYHDRGETLREKGDHPRAIRDLTTAMRLAADNDDYRRDCGGAYRERGDAHWQKGESQKALADYEQALRLRPDWGIVFNQRGLIHAATGDYPQAIADYTQAVEFDPEFAYLYLFNRGSARLAAGEPAEAVADFSAAVDLKPDYRKAYARRCQAYETMGMESEAEADRLRLKALD